MMLSEDESLLQLDRELDVRLNNLREKKPSAENIPYEGRNARFIKAVPLTGNCEDDTPIADTDRKTEGKSLFFSKSNELETVDNSERTNARRYGQPNVEHTTASDVEDIVHIRSSDRNISNCDVDDAEEIDEAKDAIFDEFLDQSTQIRIKSLTNKVAALTEALKVMQLECKRLTDAKQEACTAANAAEMSRRSMTKQLQSCQKDVSRHQKSNKHMQERVKELTTECQTLRKELSGSRQSECEHKSAQSSSYAQLTRARADNASLKEQISDMKKKHKEEVVELQGTLTNSNARIKELERQHRNQDALLKKQEQLIRVLNEQKANIGVAKAAACLEEKFLALIAPLQPP